MNQKNKGFTLIELIGVIAILAIILIVTVPTLTKMLKNDSNQKYENAINDLCLSAEQYALNYKDQLPQLETPGGRAKITIKMLKEVGYIEQHLENPKTKEEFLDTDYLLLEVGDNYLRTCKFNDGTETTPPAATVPTYTISPGATVWTNQGKTVTIHYPNVSKNRYVFEYSLDGGISWKITNSVNTDVWFSENGMIIARVRDTYDERENLNGGVFYITRIDKEPPKCTVSGGSTSWTSGSRTITGTCSDTGGSGCKENISYKYNGTVGQNYSITNAGAAGAGNGGYVYDNAGNKTLCAANQTVKIDKKAPSCTTSGGSTSWTTEEVTVYGTCSDDGSGCVGNVSKTVTTDTNGNVSPGIVKDKVGNETTCPATAVVRVDTTPPKCTVSGGSSSWTSGTRTITGTCSDDGSGCKGNISYTYNAANNTNWVLSNAGAAGAGNGGYVYDNAGNKTLCAANQTVKIDKKAPSCSVSGGSSSWTSGTRTITGTCSDDGSGCKGNISYTYNAANNTNWVLSNAGAAGAGNGGYVYDNAGNKTACAANQTVKIDKKAPTCSTSGGSSSWTNGSRTLTGTCSDDGSGCKGNASQYYNDERNGNYSPGSVSDNVGHSVSCPTNPVKIDKTKPYTPLLLSVSYSQPYYTFSCSTTSKTQDNVSCTLTAKKYYCSGSAVLNYQLYGDTAGKYNTGYTLQYQFTCTGTNCYSQDGSNPERYGNITTWTNMQYGLSQFSSYAGRAGWEGQVSESVLYLRLVDGAGNISGTFAFKSRWCV